MTGDAAEACWRSSAVLNPWSRASAYPPRGFARFRRVVLTPGWDALATPASMEGELLTIGGKQTRFGAFQGPGRFCCCRTGDDLLNRCIRALLRWP